MKRPTILEHFGTLSSELGGNNASRDHVYDKRDTSEKVSGQRFGRNVLANTLTARLKKSTKPRRDSERTQENFDNFSRVYDSEMQPEPNRKEYDGNLFLRRQVKVQKQEEFQKRNQEKMRSSIRRPSSQTSKSLRAGFPNIQNNEFREHRTPTEGWKSPRIQSPLQTNNYSRSNRVPRDPPPFPKVPVDISDPSHVKVFKYHGIFQPQNKYTSRRNLSRPDTGILKKDTEDTAEYQFMTLSLQENDDGATRSTTGSNSGSRRRKGLRVTWSGVERDREPGREELNGNESPGHETTSNDGSQCTIKSAKSDSVLIQRQSKRNKIEKIGIKWKLPPGCKEQTTSRMIRSAVYSGQHSRNLNPMSNGLQKTGMSVSRLKWQVRQDSTLSSYDLYREWLQKLEKLKAPPVQKSFIHDVPAMLPLNHMLHEPMSLSILDSHGGPQPVNLSLCTPSNV